uniref:Apolipo L3-like protein n=1 Tax=Parascaris univalens TaxID=6257 RepID=A0A914ZL91_PARUN
MYVCNDYDDKIQHLEYSIDEFIRAYHSFDINGRNLINELRNTADELEDLTTNCNISTVAASSVGVASGTMAVVGSFLLPPLLVGGIAIAAASTISNFCIQLVKFTTLRNAVGKLEKLYRRDEELAHKLDELYQIAMPLNLFDVESNSNDKDLSSCLVDGEQIAKSLGMTLCSAPAKCAAAGVHLAGEGVKSISNTAQLAGRSADGLLSLKAHISQWKMLSMNVFNVRLLVNCVPLFCNNSGQEMLAR